MPEVNLSDYVSKGEFDRLQAAFTTLQSEYNEAVAAYGEQTAAMEGLQTKLTESEKIQGQLDATTGKLRSLSHQRAYEGLADELKIRPEFRDDVWKLSAFEAKTDEPDPKALREHIGKFLESRKHYTEEGKPATKLPKGEGSDRGGKQGGGDGKFRATEKQLNDADWMSRNQSKIAAASREGNFEIVGEEA